MATAAAHSRRSPRGARAAVAAAAATTACLHRKILVDVVFIAREYGDGEPRMREHLIHMALEAHREVSIMLLCNALAGVWGGGCVTCSTGDDCVRGNMCVYRYM